MKVFLTAEEVFNVAADYLDLYDPNPDKINDIAEIMDMVYNDDLDMWEDVEERSLNIRRRQIEQRIKRTLTND